MEGNGGNSLTLIAQGAEGRVYEMDSFLGRPCIVKERIVKSYRLPVLDAKITAKRTLQEVRCMLRVGKLGVQTPCLYLVDERASKIYMEKIVGMTVKEVLRGDYNPETATYTTRALAIAAKTGAVVAKIHEGDVVHGDLTTSNLMIRQPPPDHHHGHHGVNEPDQLVVIDFGLGYPQALPEDKAVDLYVLERALHSTHPHAQPLIDEIYRSYATSPKAGPVLKKLEDVRRRGRKRDMFG